ncbi:MAG: UPF0280 family protein [Candidatus Poribacteria bacterium]
MSYQERTYRKWIKHDDLTVVRVTEGETDLLISGDIDLKEKALAPIKRYRQDISQYIARNPDFQTSLSPIDVEDDAPEIVREMAAATQKASVGPMAAVAGAIAEFVGKDLLKFSEQIIVENGGDIFIKTSQKRKLGIYAGNSPFTGKMAFRIEANQTPLGICTSAGTVGHSLSFGKADAVIIFSKSTSLADAVATATGNIVSRSEDIEKGIEFATSIEGVEGVAIIVGSSCGAWGEVTMVKA